MPDDLTGDDLDPTQPTYYTEESEDFVVDAADGEEPNARTRGLVAGNWLRRRLRHRAAVHRRIRQPGADRACPLLA